ncbi:UDP-N-acetylmuramoyl-L-alanine--D-glutamate ligase [Marinicella meishanensis]|uniref:UDP-N-acetylmuramoyl-L-alanine--D-glutamate ligase n=1 Tax=Marinicella meishanensis TaxID=2873263 RepID=UPI001CBDB24D|nr:UDP-N-acetylmuramoyl-L-alanine--D-glutamate ligase [Marinicella sp. NBU2979]
MLLETLQQARVAVWGQGVDGRAVVDYLRLRCPELTVHVLCRPAEVDDRQDPQVVFHTEAVSNELLDGFDVVVKSPGISPYQAAVQNTRAQIISSAALWFSNERSGQVIAITGTKGKSTASAMLTAVLQALGHRVVLAGNFGVPLLRCLDVQDFVVLETSSYQAQDGAIQADVAVLLNLYSEHLDWHGSETQYHWDKWRLLQAANRVVLNAKDRNTASLLSQQPLSGELIWFEQVHGFYELNEVLMWQDQALLSTYGWQLKGRHNLQNAAAVCAVMRALGADMKPVINAIKRFEPLPHRLQTVAEKDGVTYINDSISSTPHATHAALSTVNPSRTILLVGGYDRGVDWHWWIEEVAKRPPKMIICSGQNGEKIHRLILKKGIQSQCMYTAALKSAVAAAQQAAEPGDCVLLSPGAPSFDAFQDYQQRGDCFLQWLE